VKKKILAIAPVLPQPSDIEFIARSLQFLENDYAIDFIDPLSLMDDLPNAEYYQHWEDYLMKALNQYDAFLGFSFGGVILQQCFSLFRTLAKPIVLVSTPTFADSSLQQKLGNVINLCQENRLNDALHSLYHHVFYPGSAPSQSFDIVDPKTASKRLILGLTRVLQTDSTHILNHCSVEHVHLIGEHSQLVNADNVIAPRVGQLLVVPHASMRVLQDNVPFCQKAIVNTLNRESF
jgi:hypothetical protein